ncbi:GNAT family N-acetyltransferase [Rhizobium sp. CSW-27]|uniref:GNAT family N-acetyltransferase n=1 Tax=Rhizobium sp. CSW-27 TaxID=2839985 RepID=UPI001C01B407|nr:GNAT family N-acetyltransferase [Rhizobium sp. CSW-27]MBT9368355.1 GNAT family N-acetyltransferase [Rhizobium sp. CSW-27]
MTLSVLRHFEAIEADWLRLEALPRNSLHQGLDWCRAWAEAHRSRLALVVGRVEGRVAMILPLEIRRHCGVRSAVLLAHRYNNINSGLFAEDVALSPAEQRALVRDLAAALRTEADLVVLDAVPLIWRGRPHPFAALTRVPHQNHSFQLPLKADMAATIAQINAKRRRKKFRTQTRRLEEAGGFEHYTPRTSIERHALLDEFFRQKKVRFDAHGLPDSFANPAVRAFLHALLDVPPKGHDHPLMLHAVRLTGLPGRPVAAIAGLSRKGDHVICQFGSIDEARLPEASPGELLFWLMIDKACREGAALFDFGVGDQTYKRSWCPVETVLHDLLIPLTPTGRLAASLHRAMVATKAVLKRNAALYHLLQRLRAGKLLPTLTE